jgi:hypothetical protein
MKKLRFLGALALILGMTVLGCKFESDEPPAPAGQLTLAGFPSAQEGKYVMAIGNSNPDLTAVGSITRATAANTAQISAAAATIGQISGGRASLTIYDRSGPSVYSGNGSETFTVLMLDTAPVFLGPTPPSEKIGSVTLTLSNGCGMGVMGPLIPTPVSAPGKLTLTNIPDKYIGQYVFATVVTEQNTSLLALNSFNEVGVAGTPIPSSGTVVLSVYDMTYGSRFPIGYSGDDWATVVVYVFPSLSSSTFSLSELTSGSIEKGATVKYGIINFNNGIGSFSCI